MYEPHDDLAIRRILVIAAAVIAAIAVLWLLVWLIFFRHVPASHISTNHSQKGRSSQSSGSSQPSSTPRTGVGAKPATTTPPAPVTGNTNTTSNQLANTGPGDVVLPVMAAAVAGSGVYYVRLYRRNRGHS